MSAAQLFFNHTWLCRRGTFLFLLVFQMVSLGFFNVAGKNDLPYVSAGAAASNEVQRDLLGYAARLSPTEIGVRAASAWNLPLCVSCLTNEAYPSAALYDKPILQAQSQRLAASVVSRGPCEGLDCRPKGQRRAALGQLCVGLRAGRTDVQLLRGRL